MLSYEVYKWLHLISIVVFFTLGASVVFLEKPPQKLKKIIPHIFTFIIFVSGFGMLAKLKIGFPVWVWAKTLLWLSSSIVLILATRMTDQKKAYRLVLVSVILATVAITTVLFK